MIQMEQLLVDDEQQLAERADEPAADKRRNDMPAFLRGRRMTGRGLFQLFSFIISLLPLVWTVSFASRRNHRPVFPFFHIFL